MRFGIGLLVLLGVAACGSGSTSPTDPDASGQGAAGGHPFACGGSTCNSATEVCAVVMGHVPGQGATSTCVSTDGGTPSCNGPSSASAPGDCGCYESSTGEVTMTLCPP
jgi:hypothetical protein